MGNHKDLEEGAALKLDWTKLDKVASKHCDVVPVVVQDSSSLRVLIAAYVNEKALAETFERRVCCLWSTSRNELWVKGATSGDTLNLDAVFVNCEQNSLLYLVTPQRKGACHTNDPSTGESRISCYYRRVCPQADGTLRLSHFQEQPVRRASGPGWELTAALAMVAALASAAATVAVLRKR